MNFFEYQDAARTSTKKLVLLFILAVFSLVVLTYVLFLFAAQGALGTGNMAPNAPQIQHDWVTFGYIAAGVVILITLGSLFRIASLASGGASVAEMMGGELLTDAGGDVKRRRLLNVVEEMAIASGTPVPPVYIMNEQGINAFAAGYSPNDAVVGITQGAIDHLSRDELQGVIAHEFSHILNGDMRLNIRLIGILYGILMLAIIGRIILRGSRGSSRSKNGGAVIAIGLGLLVIGYVGYFFGGLIKAAVSRQREFLADASAVQFTRNPRGIAGALKRIGGYDPGAGIDNPKAEEIQHALFASSFNQVFLSMMSTHPPLEDRIKRIDPDWDGEFEYVDQTDQGRGGSGESMVSGFAGGSQAASLANAVDQIGELTAENIVYARELIDGIPEAIYRSVREPWSSRAVIYSLLLSNDNEVCNRQLEHLHNAADEGVFQEVINLAESFEETDIKMRLPIIELAMPALRQLSLPQRRLFKNNMNALVAADGRVDPFEWSLQRIVTTALDASERHKNVPARYGSFHRLKEPVSLLLSIMLYTCKIDEADHKRMMEDAGAQLGTDLYLCHRKDLSLKKLDAAVDKLRQLKPLKKPALLKACVQIVAAGTDETSTGREMLRAVADIMDCPMPPLS